MPRVAVLGSGPAGFYAAAALLRRSPTIKVDILESLPVPFGLVRYGVAPDHPHTKNATHGFSELVEHSNGRLRFFGNFPVGPDKPLSCAQLAALYDLVVYATGAARPRTLQLDDPLPDCVRSANDFVSWVNGHPDFAGESRFPPRLLGPEVAVIGAGNVALDIARMLLRSVDDLVATDISPSALDAISAARISSVGVYARRGPESASWTAAALREIVTKIPGIETRLSRKTVLRAKKVNGQKIGRTTLRCLNLLEQHTLDFDAVETASMSSGRRCAILTLNFLHTPSAFTQDITSSGSRLSVRFARGDILRSENKMFDLAFLSLGYEGKTPHPGQVSVGWANGKGKGIIGDNKVDADSVIEGLSDYDLGIGKTSGIVAAPGIDEWAQNACIQVVDWEGWLRIDAEERKRGRAMHPDRERVKIESIEEMLAIAA
jgi:ferredoxin/flavodoxin---NADP+ reductase